jgi:DNA primase
MLDIAGYMDRNFSDYRISGDDYVIDCPFCGDDTKQHMHIAIDKPLYHCFRCDAKGSWTTFVMQTLQVNYVLALAELYALPKLSKFATVNLSLITSTAKEQKEFAKLPDGFTRLADDNTINAKPYKKYLMHRGVYREAWHNYDLGYATTVPFRVIIPIEQGYWQGRSIYKWHEPKYINPHIESRSLLFNSAALTLYDEVVITEGAFSAMAVGNNAIALISKEPTNERMERILNSQAHTFIIALEKNAFGSMQRLADALVGDGRDVIIWNYSVGDPADPAGLFTEMQYTTRTKVSLLLK